MTGPQRPTSGEQPRIIRRTPTGPIPVTADDTRTGLIRRAPTGSFPRQADPDATGLIQRDPDATGLIQRDQDATGLIPRDRDATGLIQRPRLPAPPRANVPVIPGPSGGTAIATCVVGMLSGWATSVVATELITGWWHSDRLFCVAVGFLTVVFALGTISGVILVLLKRTVGRYLIAAGAVVALLTFGGVFIAGATIPWPVYAIPVLPLASAVLALLPATRRWCQVR